MNEKYSEILAKAEEARAAGRRDECIKLKKQAEDMRHGALLNRHMGAVARAKKNFPLNVYIKEIGAAPEKIKDGCGTERGWIQITLSNGKKLSPNLHWLKHGPEIYGDRGYDYMMR
jgi:hypothetical protein